MANEMDKPNWKDIADYNHRMWEMQWREWNEFIAYISKRKIYKPLIGGDKNIGGC